jgi:hypothetical protein
MIVMADNTRPSEAELLQEAEELYQKLFEALPTRVECKPGTAPKNERIPFKAHLARAALIYRAVDITGAALDLVKKKRPTPAFVLSRCVFETAAVLYLLCQRLQRVVETNKLGNIDDFLNRIAVGGRSEFQPEAPDGSIIKSVRISNAIDKLSKEHKGLAREYGFMCEFAHPNFLGTLGSYGKLNKEQDFYSFSLDASYENIPEPNVYGLNMLVVSLLIITIYQKKVTEILPKFNECVETKSKNLKDRQKQ